MTLQDILHNIEVVSVKAHQYSAEDGGETTYIVSFDAPTNGDVIAGQIEIAKPLLDKLNLAVD